jgi:hypothetical protein
MKNVYCYECGFLSWLPSIEATTREVDEVCRAEIKDGISKGQAFFGFEPSILHTLGCHRKQWIYITAISGVKASYNEISQISRPRKCALYYKYNPGYDPEEHKELKREEEMRITTRNATLLGAAVGGAMGAAGAIAAQLIYAAVTNG